MATEETPPPESAPARAFDDAYQGEVRDKLKALCDELETVEGTATVRRCLTDALRYLPA